ncbi:MAG: exopolysaccharide biosynthesis polyprenyl glycosylphosphotransferase [Candidatus Cyclobacteriaceae bacterium M3_2C_046]
MNYIYRFLLRDDIMNIFFLIFAIVDSIFLIIVIQQIDTNFLLLDDFSTQVKILLSLILVMCWILAVFIVAIVQKSNLNRFRNYMRALGIAGIIYGIGLVPLILLNEYTQITFIQTILIYLTSFFFYQANRMGFFITYKIIHNVIIKKKSFIVIGYTNNTRKLMNIFSDSSVFVRNFHGIFDSRSNMMDDLSFYHLGELDQVKEYCLKNKIDEIYYTLPNHREYLNELRKFADENFIFLGIIPDLDLDDKDFSLKTQIIDHRGIPVLSYERSPLSYQVNRFAKRSLDLIVSSIALLILAPTLFPIVALLIKLESNGPVFFKQLRTGKNCQPFWCFKFRTMQVNIESDNKQATKNDSRITKIGSFLRKTSIDELPQFFNVLIGDMSVVGPRPHMLLHTDHYSSVISSFKIRHSIEAGITGYAQVNGLRGETKELSLMERRVEYDKWYLENWSLLLDIRIILLTFLNIFKGEKTAY